MISEIARAKLNLALHVRARRPDGFHELETLFAFVADGDELRLEDAGHPGFAISGPFSADLAGEGDNLVTRARVAFEAEFGPQPPASLTLVKNLPVASGLGGGSADAAATLRLLAERAGVTDFARLARIAEGLGSDVPACLLGRTAIGRGRGEILSEVAGLTDVPVLLVNPGVAVSTRDVFMRWDGVDRGPLPTGDAAVVARDGRNDLEAPARAVAPVIGDVLEFLAGLPNAWLARMSGSGATCFALFDSVDDRDAAAEMVRTRHPGWWTLGTRLL